MLSHLPRANIVNISMLIPRQVDTLIDALLKLTLVKLHREHVDLHILFGLPHTFVVFFEGFIPQAGGFFHFFHTQEFLLDLGIHQF